MSGPGSSQQEPVKVKKVTVEDGKPYKFGRMTSNIQGTFETLIQRRQDLKAAVKASADGRHEYEAEIFRLQERRNFLQERYDKNKRWVDVYDTDIGPFENMYEDLVEEIHQLYNNAKGKHKAAIELLIKEFQYHPLFKHHDDFFSGVPFRPL